MTKLHICAHRASAGQAAAGAGCPPALGSLRWTDQSGRRAPCEPAGKNRNEVSWFQRLSRWAMHSDNPSRKRGGPTYATLNRLAHRLLSKTTGFAHSGTLFGSGKLRRRVLQRRGDRVVDPLQPDELQLVARILGDVVVVLAVARRQHHACKPGARPPRPPFP